jgi:hypothetical protein
MHSAKKILLLFGEKEQLCMRAVFSLALCPRRLAPWVRVSAKKELGNEE